MPILTAEPQPVPDLPLVYVSGKYRAATLLEILQNIAGAWQDAAEIWRMGACAICPHMNTAGFSEIFGKESIISGEQCIQGDLVMIFRCDAIFMREGWEESKGANQERDFAEEHGIPIYYTLSALEFDISERGIGHSCCGQPRVQKNFTKLREIRQEFDPVKLAGSYDSVDDFVESQRSNPKEKALSELARGYGKAIGEIQAKAFYADANPKDTVGQAKTPFHLVPASATAQEAEVMRTGAAKYGAYNWRSSAVKASVYVSALQRHVATYFDGEDLDPESGLSHLAHARANLGILLDAEACGTLIDDRPLVDLKAVISEDSQSEDGQ